MALSNINIKENNKPKTNTVTLDFPEFIERLKSAVITTNEYRERIRREALATYGLVDGLYPVPDTTILETLEDVQLEGDSGFLGLACVLVQYLETYNSQLYDIANGMRYKTGYFSQDDKSDVECVSEQPKKSFKPKAS